MCVCGGERQREGDRNSECAVFVFSCGGIRSPFLEKLLSLGKSCLASPLSFTCVPSGTEALLTLATVVNTWLRTGQSVYFTN